MSIDHNTDLAERARTELTPLLDSLQVIEYNEGAGSNASGARNAAIALLDTDIVCFLDDDAWPEPDWVEELLKPFSDNSIQMVGSRIIPEWPPGGAPRWFPAEFNWVVGGSWKGLPTVDAEIRNPIAAGMAVRRSALSAVGGFDTSMGHRQGPDTTKRYRPLGNEETDLALRISEAIPGTKIVQRPASVVHHKVTAERMEFKYFARRCWLEGLSKSQTSDRHGTSALRVELSYVLTSLTTGFFGSILALRFARAGAIVAGLSLTTAGWIVGRIQRLLPGRS